ncbi:MAG: hypothetical protein WCJ66_04995 [Verrucomicrobiota bacterium]
MSSLVVRLASCFSIAALCASCDKRQDTGPSASGGDADSAAVRAGHSPRVEVPTSRQGFRKVLAHAMEIESPEARDQALAELVRNALKPAPDLAAEAINQLSSGSGEKLALFRYCANLLAKQNPEVALTWASSLASEKDKAAMKAEIALILMATEPERAIQLITPSDITSSAPDGAAEQILRKWTATAPADAIAWVFKSPSAESRKAAVEVVTSQWLMADSKAAYAWMGELNSESTRKEATCAMAEFLVKQLPPIREILLEPAPPAIRSGLEQQVNQIAPGEKNESPLPAEIPPATGEAPPATEEVPAATGEAPPVTPPDEKP